MKYWMTKESKRRIAFGGNCKGAVPVHGKPSAAAVLPLYDQDELDATVAKEIVAAAGAYPDLLAALQELHDATKAYFQDFEHLHPIIRNRLAQARLAIDKAST